MIDFRYHLVSLIAVFLALALGIVLGAGPLREALGDTVSGRNADLTAQNDELRTERDAAVADRDAATAALDAAGEGLVGGTLPGYRVAVVALGAVDDEVTAAVDTRLTQAGATVSAHVTLADAWTDPELRSFRQGLAGYLLTHLDPAPPAGTGVEAELAQALVQGLVGATAENPDAPTENASVLLELLSTGDTPLVTTAAPVTAPADAIVLLVPTASATPSSDATAAFLALTAAAQAGSSGAVLVEVDGGPGALVAAAGGDVATVSGARGVAGQIGVPLALAQRIAGTAGRYGAGDGLAPLPPRTVAPAPNRAPATP